MMKQVTPFPTPRKFVMAGLLNKAELYLSEKVRRREKAQSAENTVDKTAKMGYTDSIINKLSKSEWATFYRSLGELKRGMWFPVSGDGDYVFEVKNKLVFTDGNYENPRITFLIEFKGLDNDEIEYGKEVFYRAAERGKVCEECYNVAGDLLGYENVIATKVRTLRTDKEGKRSSSEGERSTENYREADEEIKDTEAEDVFVTNYSFPDTTEALGEIGKADLLRSSQSELHYQQALDENGALPLGEGATEGNTRVPKKAGSENVGRFARTAIEAAENRFDRSLIERHEKESGKKY